MRKAMRPSKDKGVFRNTAIKQHPKNKSFRNVPRGGIRL